MADKLSEEGRMTALVAEMQEAISQLAGPRGFHDNKKSWLARAARKAGISPRQAKSFHYGEIGNPRVQDVEKVRAAVRSTQTTPMRRVGADHDIQRIANELDQLRLQVERLQKELLDARRG